MYQRTIVLMLTGLLAALPVGADEAYETVKASQAAIATANRRLREGADEMQNAVRNAMASLGTGDAAPWNTLSAAMSRYEEIATKNYQEIDDAVVRMLSARPNANLPTVPADGMPNYFARQMDSVREAQLAAIETQRAFLKAHRFILEAARYAAEARDAEMLAQRIKTAGYGAFHVVKTSAQAYWLGPKGLILGALWGIAHTAENLYTGNAATMMREDTRKQLVQEAEEAMQKYRELEPCVQVLETIQETMDDCRERAIRIAEARENVLKRWPGLVDDARTRQQQEIDRRIDEQQSQPRPAQTQVATWPAPALSAIQADEWMGPASDSITGLADAVQSVIDGGNPGYISTKLQDIRQEREEAAAKARAKSAAARERYWAAYAVYWQGYREACRARAEAYRGGQASRQACDAAFNSRMAALAAALTGPATAYAQANREYAICWRTTSAIGNAWSLLHLKLTSYSSATQSHFDSVVAELYAELERQKGVLGREAGPALAAYPNLRAYAIRADRLDEEIQRSLRWGGTARAVQQGLLGNVEQIRHEGQVLTASLGKARSELTQVHSVGTRATGAIESLIARDGLLLAAGHAVNGLVWYAGMVGNWEPPTFAGLAEGRDNLLDRATEMFVVRDPTWIEEAGKLDASAIARQYEAAAARFNDGIAAQGFFETRLVDAVRKLDPVSQRRTGAPLVAVREGSGTAAAAKELTTPQWTQVAGVCNDLPAGAREPLAAHDRSVFADKLPRQQLLHAVTWLHRQAGEQMASYLALKSRGGFGGVSVVPAANFKELSESWETLKPALDAFDAKAAGQAGELNRTREEVMALWAPVPAAYGQIPAYAQRDVAERYQRANNAVAWLGQYLSAMAAGLQPIGASHQARANLQTWITDYPQDLANFRAAQETARREAEARRRQVEEAKRRAEEQRQQIVGAVTTFYEAFAEKYRRRDAAAIVGMLDDNWSAGDGGTLANLETTLGNSFRVFDEVECTISGLQVTQQGADRVRAEYQITIVGHIRRNHIKHKESSRVVEELRVDGPAVVILRTLDGRFWTNR